LSVIFYKRKPFFRYWTHVPWKYGAVGTAVWTGTPLKGLLEEAGLQDKAIELLFTGLDQGVQGGEMQYYQRSLTIDDATRNEVCAVRTLACLGGFK
jgi:DMSO/TMAO reductase YedYZ molybdopterin-dependent catalytic subunit